MARKESITIQDILETAFRMTREEGFANVTARRVAARVGCSTQPIFRVYKNMEELCHAVYDRAVIFFQEYIEGKESKSKIPFVDLGMSYISFAMEEKHLFQLLFITKGSVQKEMYEVVNGERGNVVREITKAAGQGCTNASDMFMQMWIFIHGAACMGMTGDYDLKEKETIHLLEEAYRSFAKGGV